MPKLRQPLEEIKNKELVAIIAMRKNLCGMTNVDIAKILLCHENTVTNRLKHPETLTLGELRLLCDKLHFSSEERSSILSKERYL